MAFGPAPAATDPFDWAERGTNPVPPGATIRLDFDRQEFFLGEDVMVHFVLENKGDQPFTYDTGGDYRGSSRALRFKVTATDDAGHVAEDPDPSPICFGGIGGPRSLKPGEKFTAELALARYCDITQPGRYTIHATHDFGWKKSAGKHPAGEAVIKFRVPMSSDAERIVSDLEKLPADKADYSCLRNPAYLEPQTRRARAGDQRALHGIGSIPAPAATEALITLAGGSDTNLSLTAAMTLNSRLPDPEFEGKLPGRGPFRFDYMESRRRLAARSWDAKFAPVVRALAMKFLARPETKAIGSGAFMVQAVGTTNEARAVLAALDRVLEPLVNPRRDPKDNILNDPEPIPELRRAMQLLEARGFVLGQGLSGQAQFLEYFASLIDKPPPRPSDWLRLLEVFGDNCRYPVREAAVRSIPQPVPAECYAFIKARLADKDLGVCRAACELAGKSGNRDFRKPLLEIIATENHEWLLREASNAMFALGGGYDLLTTWADRLGDEHLYDLALDALQTVLEGLPGGSSGRTDLTRPERLELRRQWQEFLAAHADELRQGKKFKVGDPAITPALFGRARSWQLPGGKFWPMSYSNQARLPQ